jgi:hypothetical protein
MENRVWFGTRYLLNRTLRSNLSPLHPQGCVPVEEPVLALCEPGPCGDNAECIINDSGEDCRCNPGFSGNPFQVR